MTKCNWIFFIYPLQCCLSISRLSTLVVQTMSLMFGETEKDAARFSVLTSKQ